VFEKRIINIQHHVQDHINTLPGRKGMDSIVRAVIAKFEERSRVGLAK
jgi:uncharacterized protein (DUF779 family)